MKKIFKYPLNFGKTRFWVPKDAEVLTVQLQNEVPHIWMLVDELEDVEERAFVMIPTGEYTSHSKNTYVGTIQQNGRVGHIFETIPIKSI